MQGNPSNEHSGFINGFSTYTLRVPGQKLYVTVLTNSEQFWPDDFAAELAAIAIGQPFNKTRITDADVAPWLGSYDFGNGDVRELKQDADNLVLLQEGKPTTVVPAADGRYYLGEGLDYLSFERRTDGKVAMTLHNRLMGESTGLR